MYLDFNNGKDYTMSHIAWTATEAVLYCTETKLVTEILLDDTNICMVDPFYWDYFVR